MASNKTTYTRAQPVEAAPAIVEGFGPATRNCTTREEFKEFIKRVRAFVGPRVHGDMPVPLVFRANKAYKPVPHIVFYVITTRKHVSVDIPEPIGEFGQIIVVIARRPQSITFHGGIVAEETARIFTDTHLMRFVDFSVRADCRAIYMSEKIQATADIWSRAEPRARDLILTRKPSRQMLDVARAHAEASAHIIKSLSELVEKARAAH